MSSSTLQRGDRAVETAADKLATFVRGARGSGGLKAKLAGVLADDPDFLRKLKPSLIAARAKGQAPTDVPSGGPRLAPSGPQIARPKVRRTGGPSPWAVLGVALVTGYVLAKTIDWRGHAHPRD